MKLFKSNGTGSSHIIGSMGNCDDVTKLTWRSEETVAILSLNLSQKS